MRYAKVIINISADAVDKAFTYGVPDELEDRIGPGTWVEVPFGRSGRLIEGLVMELTDRCELDEARIKPVARVLDRYNDMPGEFIELAQAMAREYCSTLNQALRTVQPVIKTVRADRRRSDPVERIGAHYGAAADILGLNPDQQKAADEIMRDRRVSLLYGITGSGKTRVYIELIRRMTEAGKQTIVLIPEISLSYQTVGELINSLGPRVALIHSRLSEGEKYEQFMKAAGGEIDVCVGPRSAVFTPFKDLGLIIIDEEHERSYRSDMSPTYDARWVAGVRTSMHGAKLLLASATPSLYSYKKALSGEYALHTLLKRASDGIRLPLVTVADMRTELLAGNHSVLSRILEEKIRERLKRGEQTMLFLNRRGYANFASCRSCGHALKCPRCDVAMTVHNAWYKDPVTGSRSPLLRCHYCGYEAPLPGTCPVCGSRHIAPFGGGTQKLELSVKKIFPEARVFRMDFDTTRKKGSYEEILSAMRERRADILIGTQMIVKGHDFPYVTLVGIVAADMSLNIPRYDAAERTFELITQAAGRSGRGSLAGEVIIQSYEPEHYALTLAAEQDFPGFYEREIGYRKLLKYPPEIYMLSLRFKSEDEELAGDAAQYAASLIAGMGVDSLEIFGPVNDNIYKINSSYRKILYIKHGEHDIINTVLSRALTALKEAYGDRDLYVSSEIE